ncbi:hypothetical protein LCGC14_2900890 [marine sediment metagenome]|uniref:Uncharacterized protein n=1 Tax=marine sediment metagenome TaxID=412755 RepID=A0A0F9AKK7_9ZZZZ
MIDQQFADLLMSFESQKFGVSKPTFRVGSTPRGILGYYKEDENLVVINPDGNAEVVVHEFAHRLAAGRNMDFPDDNEEHKWVWEFVREEMDDLGMPLKTFKPYKWAFRADQELDHKQIYETMTKNQNAVGINVKNLETRGNEMIITFTPTTSAELIGDMPPAGVQPIAPIIWGILGLASLAGISFTAWKAEQIMSQTGAKWIAPVAIIGAASILIFVVAKAIK